MTINELDQKAQNIAKNYKNLEAELLQIIIQLDLRKAFYKLGYNSLFAYTTETLKLSPSQAYNFIKVARKSQEIPKLKEEILSGNLSISKAQKMTPILTKDNQAHWIKLAKEKTHRQLEKEVALAAPNLAVKESSNYICRDKEIKEQVKIHTSVPRIQLKLGVSEKIMLKLRRAQDLESQRSKKNQSLEQTLETLLEIYLDKKDPVRKAKRQKLRGKLSVPREKSNHTTRVKNLTTICQNEHENENEHGNENEHENEHNYETSYEKIINKRKPTQRTPIPSNVIHEVQLRDQSQCTYIDTNGKRCSSRRYIEVHHLKAVSKGGTNKLENLALLCSGHHKVEHLRC